MKLRPTLGLLGILAGMVLAGGCRTMPSESCPGGEQSARAVEPEWVIQKRALAHAHYAQAVLDELRGRETDAVEEYHQAAELDPGNEQLVVEVARRWLLKKQPERALDILKLGVAQPDSSAMLDALLGTAYFQLGQADLAVVANRQAIKKSPLLLAGYQNIYFNSIQASQVDDAMKVLDEASRQKDADAEFLAGLSELYLNLATTDPSTKTNAHARVLDLLNRADTLTVTNIQTRLRLADAMNTVGQGERAAVWYQGLLSDYPQAPVLQEKLRAKLTDIYLRGKDPKRAVEQLEAITRADPLNMQAHYFLALLATEDGDAARAETHLKRALLANPKFEQAYYDLAMAQLRQAETNEVFLTLEDAQKRFGQNFVSEFLLGVACVQTGKFDEGVRHFTAAEVIARATDSQRLTPQFYFQMSMAFERKGDYSTAVKHLEKALELKPDFAEAANFLGYLWAERGENLERARDLIDLAVKAEPKNDAYLDSLAWVLFKLGRSGEALPVMLQAVELAEADGRPDATLFDHLGDIYSATGDVPKACAAWDKALKLAPNEEIRKKRDGAAGR